MKRITVMTILILVAVMGSSAVLAQDIHPRPVIAIHTVEDDATHEGVLSDYCWLTDANDHDCDALVDEPETTILVKNGDAVEIIIEGEASIPDTLLLEFIDDLDSNGDPITVTLTPDDPSVWTVDLAEGLHNVRVEAAYPFSEISYVAYLFTFEVAAPTPTPTATQAPTEAPTATATEAPPTEAPSPTPTEEITEEVTVEATAESTEAATEAVTETPTEEPSATPTATPTGVAMPLTPTPSGGPALTGVTLESGGKTFVALAVNFCRGDEGEAPTCFETAADAPSERLTVPPLGAFLVRIAEPAPAQVTLQFLTSDGQPLTTPGGAVLYRETRRGQPVLLYTPPIFDVGSYLFAVEVPGENATYYFQILISAEEIMPGPTATSEPVG